MKKDEYPIVFAEDLFGEGNTTLAETLRAATGSERPRVMLVADMNVVQRTEGLGTRIGRYVQAHGIELAGQTVVLSGGEKVKCDGMQSAMRVASAAIDAKIGSNGCMLVLGGGTVLDVAGWAASQARGGVKLVRVPTTVAAMVDAAYAGCAALDVAGVKDALRVRSVPAAVVVDLAFADTILDGVWRAGFSEAVRIAAVSDAPLARKLASLAGPYASRDRAAMEETVRLSVAARRKKGPTGFALWSALRLEAMSGYKLPHGYAVAIGIAVDATYAQLKGLVGEDVRDSLCGMLEACGAMDGAMHSRHLLGQTEAVLKGLDAWRLSTGGDAIELPGGLGKRAVDEKPDRETMKQALNMLK